MTERRVLPTNRNAEADRTTNTSNVTTTPTHTLTGRDPESSLTDIFNIAETSEVATPKYRYSKRPFGKFKFSPILICVNFVSILPDLC